MRGFRLGDRVRISDGSGTLSGKVGTVTRPGPTNHRGIPIQVQGAYKPVAATEVWLQMDDGTIETMYRNRLRKVEG